MNYYVVITENGTEKILIIDTLPQQTNADIALETINGHTAQTDNPHQTSLQQVVTKQGMTPIDGGIQIGSTDRNDELLTLLKSAIVIALNGDLRASSIDINGFHHTTQDGYYVDMDNGGVHLYNGSNSITVNYDGTITGLQIGRAHV